MKRLLGTAVILSTLVLAACGSDATQAGDAATASSSVTSVDSTSPALLRLWIQPDTVECIGEAVQQCMQVSEAEDGAYLNFYDAIEGFTFEAGTSYVIDVEITTVEDPPADGSSLAYRLVEIVESSN